MSFMISRETENIQSLSEVEGAFRAITANGDKPYVTKDEIFQVLTTYRRLWLISACAYSGKRKVSMRLIKDMRLYGT